MICFHVSMLGASAFDSRKRQGIFFPSETSRPALRLTQTLVQWVPSSLPGTVEQAGA